MAGVTTMCKSHRNRIILGALYFADGRVDLLITAVRLQLYPLIAVSRYRFMARVHPRPSVLPVIINGCFLSPIRCGF